jgi:L-threonylcarbamoyladenylate synthase
MITTSIEQAASALIKGEVIGLPTETVYGLAANCYNEEAVKKIFELKKRPNDNPLIVHVKDASAVEGLVTSIPEIAKRLMHEFWPGPLTLLLPKSNTISDSVTANSPLVALRSPDHEMALELLKTIDFPLVAPSANPFMSVSPTSAQHVADYFGNKISIILDGGPCNKGIESTIVGFEGNEIIIYREGIITGELILSTLGDVTVRKIDGQNVLHPGMYKRHYAPKTPLIVCKDISVEIQNYSDKKIAVLSFVPIEGIACFRSAVLSEKGSLEEAAQNLYAHLIELDKSGADMIVTQPLPDYGIGKALNEKLNKASTPIEQ